VLLLPAANPMARRAEALGEPTVLAKRLQQWPDWHLPAPLPRASQRNQNWPAWFVGDWRVSSAPLADGRIDDGMAAAGTLTWTVRFRADGRGGAVADRAFNARAIGQVLLGDQLLAVQDDPANPDRQLSRLSGDRLLESTVLALGAERAPTDPSAPETFLSDELSLQVLHRAGLEPRVSQVETLGRWHQRADGGIDGEQWQASYPSPAAGLIASPVATDHLALRLDPLPPESDPAS
jgi:hypothetical protein